MIESAHWKDVKGWRWAHFTAREMACKHCDAVKVDETFMDKMDQLRSNLGFPISISSGYRCPDHNAKVSTTGRDGPHTTGKAADPQVSGERAFKLMAEALRLGFKGIGLSQKGPHGSRFVHVDTLENGPGCPRPTVWSY